jgi:hypothetical protein
MVPVTSIVCPKYVCAGSVGKFATSLAKMVVMNPSV